MELWAFIDPAVVLSTLCYFSLLGFRVMYLVVLSEFVHIALYLYYRWIFNYQEVNIGISLTYLTLTHICTCPKPWPRFAYDYICITWSSLHSIIWGERWWFVLLTLVELLTITVETFFFHNQFFIYILTF